ncbi:hypothetical protein [Glycomyces paridis]|uniref:Uncharacterized protein n=1 Tax=Glycomyces paridis TaxID=2126555 RepID=A0A4S8PCL3_9ACTN|nr:hypothetical protein [Glycomyces paridis]THV26024.1 hypothetical protein E9998_20045 [Glycomyces paridis]
MSATRVYLREKGGPAVPYTALIGREETLVRYQSVIDPARHFDVVRVPHRGDLEWLGEWHRSWSDEARDRFIADVRALPHD